MNGIRAAHSHLVLASSTGDAAIQDTLPPAQDFLTHALLEKHGSQSVVCSILWTNVCCTRECTDWHIARYAGACEKFVQQPKTGRAKYCNRCAGGRKRAEQGFAIPSRQGVLQHINSQALARDRCTTLLDLCKVPSFTCS
jgi:hypothetical protein